MIQKSSSYWLDSNVNILNITVVVANIETSFKELLGVKTLRSFNTNQHSINLSKLGRW